jgi:NADH-quinone oxidoreductase subunit J
LCGNLFLFELDFLPLILIVIYVGAISILFLFVIMMLDIKFISKNQNQLSSVVVSLFLSVFFLVSIFLSVENTIFAAVGSNNISFDWTNFVDKLVLLNSLGQYLYLDFVVHFLVVGLILLVAIIGAVVLTVQFNRPDSYRGQYLFKQISKTNLETFYLCK